jgi:regulator of RNase E activity RraA
MLTIDPTMTALLRSALVSDALDAIGLRAQCLGPGLAPLDPRHVIVGRAFPVTVELRDEPADPPYQGLLRALDAVAAGEVFIHQAGRSDRAAVWGELVSTACLAKGVAGALTDGPTRDSERIRALGFPVVCRGTLPCDVNGRLEVVAHGEPIVVDGVTIRHGDLVVADADGAVIVPHEVADGIVAAAVAKATSESNFRRAVAAGMSPSAAFERFGVL